ncbi:hypothetical protein ABZ816_23655 [Actinosynnema sp. NPDC047251]|nr:hypothetical protein [Saccharothrix espanaensis]
MDDDRPAEEPPRRPTAGRRVINGLVVAGLAMVGWTLLRADLLPSPGWLSRWWPAVASLLLFGVAFAVWRKGRVPRAAEPAVRRDWTQVITAATALGALVFTALSLRAAQEQIEVAEQGQITDRYAKAVQLLGPRR